MGEGRLRGVVALFKDRSIDPSSPKNQQHDDHQNAFIFYQTHCGGLL